MKKIFSFFWIFILSLSLFSTEKNIKSVIEKQWEVNGLSTPESVCFDSVRNVFFVSNVAGKPAAKDRNGFITKLDSTGKIVSLKWIDGLNAPKGLAICGNKLFVTDIDELVEIDISEQKIRKKYKIRKAKFLNDVVCDSENVFISDTAANCIFRMKDGNISCRLKDRKIKKPNGLLLQKDALYIGNFADGSLFKFDLKNEEITKIGSNNRGIDGLADFGNGNYLVSDWQSRIDILSSNGELKTFLNLKKQGENAADILYLPKRKLLLIPTFFGNKIIAYKIKEK